MYCSSHNGSLLMPVELGNIVEKIAETLRDNEKIVFAILFGSYARGLINVHSDVDLAIYFKERPSFDELSELISSIALALNVPEDKIDILILDDDVPYELRYKVFRDGIPILINDENEFKRYRDKSISLYLDFKVFKQKFDLDRKYIMALKRSFYGRSDN